MTELATEISKYLTPKQAAAVCLVYESHLPESGAGKQMGCCKRVVNKHLHAAFTKLDVALPGLAKKLRDDRAEREAAVKEKRRASRPVVDYSAVPWDKHVAIVKSVVNWLLMRGRNRGYDAVLDRDLLIAEGNAAVVKAVAEGNTAIRTTVRNALLNAIRNDQRRRRIEREGWLDIYLTLEPQLPIGGGRQTPRRKPDK